MRLRRSHPSSEPCLRRRRCGKGFSYRWSTGDPVDAATRERIESLAIPPAWTDVWICPWPHGHIQAVGLDARGRRQYRYHDAWRVHRDREKFRRVLGFGQRLPELRRRVAADLGGEVTLSRAQVLACTVRLLDEGCFRIGGEVYAEENETFGVATLQRRHVRVSGSTVRCCYPAKGSIEREVVVDDPEVAAVVAVLRRRRGGDGHLLAYRDGRRWVEVRSSDVNEYLKEVLGEEFSAKDFRTWSATVHAAALLARSEAPVTGGRRRDPVVAAVRATAEWMGNTPAVCRSSYIDPGVIDRFSAGETIGTLGARSLTVPLTGPDRLRAEQAVLALLSETAADVGAA